MISQRRGTLSGNGARGFTLIELLVVVAIIAILISILLPSLSAARAQARAAVCAAHLNHVGKAVATYLAEWNATYPASYLYAHDDSETGYWLLEEQYDGSPVKERFPYIHWSWYLYENGKVDQKAFQCPEMRDGGAPRTQYGPESKGLANQANPNGNPDIIDLQAEFVAFTANAAIMPRNKFYDDRHGTGTRRFNRFVKEAEVSGTRRVVLATEFNENWENVAQNYDQGGKMVSKAHRPLTGFGHIRGGTNGNWMYEIPKNLRIDFYTGNGDPDSDYGVVAEEEIGKTRWLDGDRQWNAIGRHHPGGDRLGGSSNFLFVDGGVERKAVLETMRNFEWGDAFYSLTGHNKVEIKY